MTGDTSAESRNPIRHFHRRGSRKEKTSEISTPLLQSTNAAARDDLYALPTRIEASGLVRPKTSDGSSIFKKRLHIADLVIDDIPRTRALPLRRQSDEATSPDSIGLALGSPSQWPMPPGHRRHISHDSIVAPVVPYTSRSIGTKKTSRSPPRRNLFSAIFGRKPSNAAQHQPNIMRIHDPSAQTQWTNRPQERKRSIEQLPSGPISQVTPRWNEVGRKMSTGLRPKSNKAVTVPASYPEIPPSPPPKDFPPSTPSITIPTTEPVSTAPPLLKVQIPDVRMDRYSIMFSDVLDPRKSLLARRQTTLKELQLHDYPVQESTIETKDCAPARRASLPSSPNSPRISLFPAPPSSNSISGFQRSGLSRSNTVPSPNRQEFVQPVYPKRKESQSENICSPSHGSETPMSTRSGWQSDDTRDLSDISDEDLYEDDTSGDILIQLSDTEVPQSLPPVTCDCGSGIAARNPTTSAVIRKPVPNQTINLVSVNEFRHAPRTSSRIRSASDQASPIPSPRLPRKHSLPSAVQTPGMHSGRERSIPYTAYAQIATTRTIPYFNPLQSSPCTPKEITLARQLSLTRPTYGPAAVSKSVQKSQVITIVNPDNLPEPKDWRIPTASHLRNRSEHVVVESS